VNARVAERVLSRMADHAITSLEDGDEIIRRCIAGEFDAIVMDVSLASTSVAGQAVDGLRLTRLLDEICPRGRPPVLLMTAHAMRGDRDRLLAASGADGYIAKPIADHHELVVQVKLLLSE
jgi:two-component system, cell cycle response regulator DivK